MELTKVFIYFLIAINMIAFMMMGIDKQKARRKQARIRERTLFGIACFGGAIGMIIAMYMFRHKTRHLSFKIGLPMIVAIQFIIYYVIKVTMIR